MLVGYMRAGGADGARALDPQRDALLAAGVDPARPHEDRASGRREDRPGLDACLEGLRPGDTLVAWRLDRLGRDLRHLVGLVHGLAGLGVGLRVLAGEGAAIDTVAPDGGRPVAGVFAALAEFDREMMVERTRAGLAAARARGRRGGRPYKMTPAKLRLAQAAMGRRETGVGGLCAELGVTRQSLYRHVDPRGRLRPDGERLLRRRQTEREQGAPPADTRGIDAGDRHG